MKSQHKTVRRRGSRRRTTTPGASTFTLAELAAAVDGRVAGDPNVRLSGVRSLEDAGPHDLSWVAGERRGPLARRSAAGAVLAPSEAAAGGKPAVLVDSPALALARWLELRLPARRHLPGVARGARVHSTARLGRGASVAPGATVGAGARIGARTRISEGAFVGDGAEIGDDCVVHPNAVVREGCVVGSRCTIHSGAVVGSDGFGYVWDGRAHRKIPQVGIVRVGDDVEIGANAAIDRATLGETRIGRGTKIDNLVQIGHNVVVGEDVILCGQAGIAGSARIEDRATLAGQVGVNDHVTVGRGAIATGQAGVTGSIAPGEVVSGMPAAPHREFLRRAALVARLPELSRRLEALERRLAEIEKGGPSWRSESPKS
ncbi:MAG TPA: UDP-3-O-(3-hydroxymyristoyl)glucosamine N-acyltransferase [Thermoanaerobaculia bacterium]|nr:UDP-3-O-(3-hydroxymyristoyl)glucosamine N-acyltransferase [Thermoanaerobaculia bacterium]